LNLKQNNQINNNTNQTNEHINNINTAIAGPIQHEYDKLSQQQQQQQIQNNKNNIITKHETLITHNINHDSNRPNLVKNCNLTGNAPDLDSDNDDII
jgi:hypothetical protein